MIKNSKSRSQGNEQNNAQSTGGTAEPSDTPINAAQKDTQKNKNTNLNKKSDITPQNNGGNSNKNNSTDSNLPSRVTRPKSSAETAPRSKTKIHPRLKFRNSLNESDSLDKINLHRVYNKKEDFKPLGQGITSSQYKNTADHEQQTYTAFGRMLNENQIDYQKLKSKAWRGVPAAYRSVVWKIILDYQPTNREQAEEQLKRMRGEYMGYAHQYFENETVRQNLSKAEINMMKVVETDVPRTQPMYPIYKAPSIQQMLKRILTVWGLRHPACGYVQGINEIATPFILVFLSQYVPLDGKKNYPIPEGFSELQQNILEEIEADTYWCLSKILDKIQDNYTNGQPGIKISLDKICQIVARTDPELGAHFKKERVEYIQFSFRWILCLLVREFPLQQVFRIFDTYLADDKGFAVLHVYMCAALLLKYSKKIQKMKFNDIVIFLQNLPTQNWSDEDIEMLLAEAFVYMNLYEQTHGHIKPSPNMVWQ